MTGSVAGAETMIEDETPEPGQASSTATWDVTLGLGVAGVPNFPGAKSEHAQPLPLVSIRYRDLVFFGPGGLGLNVIHHDSVRAGPILGFSTGRSQSDDPHLNGLSNIQPSANAGGFITYSPGPFEVGATIRQAVTHAGYGLTAQLEANYQRALLPHELALSAGPELDLADGAYNRTWFGVTPSEASRSGLAAYRPGAGFRDAGLHANLTYHYSEHILVRGLADFRELVGDPAASPIVQRRAQLVVGAGVAYHF